MTERKKVQLSARSNHTSHSSNNNSSSSMNHHNNSISRNEKTVPTIWTEDRKQQTIDWAIHLYDRILRLNPHADTCFLLLRSFCLSESGSFDAALTDADVVVRQWPDRPDGYFVREKALAGLRKYLEAAEAQKRVNDLQSGSSSSSSSSDNLTEVLKQQVARHWLVWSVSREGEHVEVEGKSNRSSEEKQKSSSSSRKQGKSSSSRDEKKRGSDKRRSPAASDLSTSTSSRTPAPASSKVVIESKVTRVEKPSPSATRVRDQRLSPAGRKLVREEVGHVRLDDSACDNYEIVDDINYHSYDQDLDIETAFTPPQPPTRPRSPHSPAEPMPISSRSRSDRRSPPSFTGSGESMERKRIRMDRSPRSRSPAGRRDSFPSPIGHHGDRRSFSGPSGRRMSRSRSPIFPSRTQQHHHPHDSRDLPINIYRFTAIRIRNIYPHIAQKLLDGVASKYGRVVNIETKDKEAIITYGDTESPRRAICELHDTFVPRVSNFNDKLHVRFALGSNQDKFHMRNVKRVECDECHFYRTTGCDDPKCPEKHVPFNAGIDLQPWMGKPRPGSLSSANAPPSFRQ